MVASLIAVALGFASTSVDLISRTQVHMGTFVTISLPLEKRELFSKAFERVVSMEKIFSTYDSQASLYQLNNQKRLKNPPRELLTLLARSAKIYKESGGYFSIAVGSITKKLYRFGQKNEQIPDKMAMRQAHSDLLGFTVKEGAITLKKGVILDMGGIAKGFTVDRLKELLLDAGVRHFVIALSGDIYCQGSCSVAIRSPFDKEEVMQTLKLHTCAISTSGNYERYIKDKKHNHLIDPKRKQSQEGIASMTLYSKSVDNTSLDAYATALSVMPHKNRMEFLKRHPEIEYIFFTTSKERYSSR